MPLVDDFQGDRVLVYFSRLTFRFFFFFFILNVISLDKHIMQKKCKFCIILCYSAFISIIMDILWHLFNSIQKQNFCRKIFRAEKMAFLIVFVSNCSLDGDFSCEFNVLCKCRGRKNLCDICYYIYLKEIMWLKWVRHTNCIHAIMLLWLFYPWKIASHTIC